MLGPGRGGGSGGGPPAQGTAQPSRSCPPAPGQAPYGAGAGDRPPKAGMGDADPGLVLRGFLGAREGPSEGARRGPSETIA